MKQARDLLQNSEEEAAFYDESMRQEIFNDLIGIRCRKEYREAYQRLVRDGIASIEGIRLSYLFIYSSNSEIAVRISWFNRISAFFLFLQFILGTLLMPRFLFDLLRNLNLHAFPSRLLGLSVATLLCFSALKRLLPLAAAWGIMTRLKKLEEKNKECAVSPPEQITVANEQSTQNA